MTLTLRAREQILTTAIDSRNRTTRQLEQMAVQLETIQTRMTDLRNILSTLDYCIELLQEQINTGNVGTDPKK